MIEERVTATPEAMESLDKLKQEIGPIMFYQTGGCCDDNLPICFKLDEFIAGQNDVLFGKVNGIPVYVDSRLFDVWENVQLILDIAKGESVEFSIAPGHDLHFVTKSRMITFDLSLDSSSSL